MKRKAKGKEGSHLRSQRSLVALLSAFCAILVLAHLGASFLPEGRIWGINQWSYFSPAISLLAGVLALLFFVPSVNQLARRGLSFLVSSVSSRLRHIHVFGEKNKYRWYLASSFLFFIPFWLLRDRTHFLGDGAQIISRMNSGELSVNLAEPLEIFLHLKVFGLAHRLLQLDSAEVYSLLSCLAGVLFVFLAFLFADFWGKERRERVFVFLILLSVGSIQLFFGYVEHYIFLYVLIFGFIFSSLAYLEGKLRWFFPLATFALASLSHLSALHLLPSLLFILAVGSKEDKSSLLRKILIGVLGLALAGLIMVLYKNYSWTVPPIFVPLSVDTYEAPGYLLFSLPHILDFLNQQLLASPVGLIMILAPLACGIGTSLLRNRLFGFLLLISALQLGANFLLNPGLGASRDWDLFSAVGLGYTILGLFILLRLLRDKSAFGYVSMILVISSLYSTAPWIILNSNPDKSISRFQNLLEIDQKRSANGHFILRKYFEAQGMEKQAKEQNEEYHRTFPELVLASEGLRLGRLGELEEAEEMLLRALELAPNMAQIRNDLGHVYWKRGRVEEAEAQFQKAIELSPFLPLPYVNLADVYLLRKEYDLALDACRRAIRLKTDYPETYSNAATIYLIKGELEQAEAHYKKALSVDPGFVDAYVGLGDIYNRKTMPYEATEMYRKAVYLDPDMPKAHFRLGMTYLSLNLKEGARRELELYLRIAPPGKNAQQAKETLERLGE